MRRLRPRRRSLNRIACGLLLALPALAWAHAPHPAVHAAVHGAAHAAAHSTTATVECDGSSCLDSPTQHLTPADQLVLAGLRLPVSHPIVSSPYGMRFNPILRRRVLHCGIDYGSPSGTPVYAAQDGVVELASAQNHLGIFVRIRHSPRIETLYAHLHRFMPGLRTGSVLRRGDIVGFVGESGFATGPHLHYEVIVNGMPVDPTPANANNPLRVAALK